MPDASDRPLLLSLVIPVHNEAGTIAGVVAEWDRELARWAVPYEIRVYDDGSTDGTAAVLGDLVPSHPALVIVRHPNRGHGPTILRGYGESRGKWVFQVDGDGDMSAAYASSLWTERDADVVLGYRVGRRVSPGRHLITAVSWWTVRGLFGAGARDVNTPYRLLRRVTLRRLLSAVPPDAFAPNVMLTGLALRAGMRVVEVPVPHRGRLAGEPRSVAPRMWRAAARAFLETVRVARGPVPPPAAREAEAS